MFLEITQGGEELCAVTAIESFAIVQSKMCSKSVSGVECFLTSALGTFKWFDFCMNPDMNLQRVRCQECFPTSVLCTLKTIFTY